MRISLLQTLNAERAARRLTAVVTDITSGAQRLVGENAVADDELGGALAAQMRSGKSGTLTHNGRAFHVTVYSPPLRLVLVGAVHISQFLAPMAKLADFDVTIIDPRTAFASKARFPDVKLLALWPDEAPPIQNLDHYTGVALLTHDPKIDDPALIAALRADCFYIGALGSRKTHGARVERMTAAGFTPADMTRIHAPIGLDIGAVSPVEIATSVLAEIILSLRKKPLRTEVAA
ncbi:MAG: XdhC family protein [Hyphomicrobiales bacterium]|nr:XdhC family protein [Hyphomicrobiales bacterium]MDE2115346.1 XdhC family protein [Hyphomicrobiales bacterium]